MPMKKKFHHLLKRFQKVFDKIDIYIYSPQNSKNNIVSAQNIIINEKILQYLPLKIRTRKYLSKTILYNILKVDSMQLHHTRT